MEAATDAVSMRDPPSKAVTVQSTPSNHGFVAAKDIAFGSLAGVVGKIVEYPFDTVKVRLQSQPDTQPSRYRGPLDCFKKSIRQEGLRGLYRGISAPMVGAAAETSSLFFSYSVAKDVLQTTVYGSSETLALPLSALVACGAASGAFTSLVLTPIELVKCQMQVPAAPVISIHHQASSSTPPGPLSIMRSVYRRYGLLGFWHGQLGTLIRETGGSAAWFGSYEAMLLLFRRFASSLTSEGAISTPEPESSSPSISQQLVAGAIAGMSYNFIFFPADVVKTRMQTEELAIPTSTSALRASTSATSPSVSSKRATFRHVASALWRQQGLRGFYRGCGITVLRSAPSSALIFTIYEALKKRFI